MGNAVSFVKTQGHLVVFLSAQMPSLSFPNDRLNGLIDSKFNDAAPTVKVALCRK
jgi:hypothetical protein